MTSFGIFETSSGLETSFLFGEAARSGEAVGFRETVVLAGGIGGKPAFADAFHLLFHFKNTPETAERCHPEEALADKVGDKERHHEKHKAGRHEPPFALLAEIVLPFYYQGME